MVRRRGSAGRELPDPDPLQPRTDGEGRHAHRCGLGRGRLPVYDDARGNPDGPDHDDAQCAGGGGGRVGGVAGSRGLSAECGVLGGECGVEAVRRNA